ncbi:exodeoxyribonuclease VII small subunit [Paenibacillus pasadenensis]|uniref:exodeoxyribonuclease VII small subunit n=1 Tax=Paenibacillus pasadenensis TaxID=217090 RepID=UPI00203B19CF|nr:exodeoxyribonuclease VII small subunit [Paenibacillus pasadenensis]MCM3747306.1 exodeoxyribonuclease VII small subunit [Paenibacillus pasadenensis]
MSKETQEQELSFEQAMEQLEEIVERLESGDVPLETAIELFQEGMRLSRLCGGKLEQVERKIESLLDSGMQLKTEPFTDESDDRGDFR